MLQTSKEISSGLFFRFNKITFHHEIVKLCYIFFYRQLFLIEVDKLKEYILSINVWQIFSLKFFFHLFPSRNSSPFFTSPLLNF